MPVGLYKIENIITKDYYIGSSYNIISRLAVHKSLLRRNKHASIYLQRAWNKFGEDAFEFRILLICDKKLTRVYEQSFIDKLNPKYNMSKNANGADRDYFTLESRRKAGITRRGVPKPKSYSEKLSQRMLGNKVWLGKNHTEESRRKMSLAQVGNKKWLGKKHSEETKRKIGEASRAYWASVKAEKEGRSNA